MMERLDEAVDHVRGGPQGRLIVEYGDYECPYSRAAFRHIGRVETKLGDGVAFELLFRRQKALEDEDLRG